MTPAFMKTGFIILLLTLVSAPCAHGKVCTPQEAEAANAMVDELDSWARVDKAVRRFEHCDDGSIAEGNSEAVARLLVDKWQTLPQLAELIKRDPVLKRFILRHIDATLDTKDLEQMKKLASSSCPRKLISLCKDIRGAATRAAK
jgi:hypothetical protein